MRGLFFGDAGQFLAQIIGAVTCAVFVLGLSYIFFRLQDRWQGIRVSPQVEVDGVDVHEMGISAYPSGTQLHLTVPYVESGKESEYAQKAAGKR